MAWKSPSGIDLKKVGRCFGEEVVDDEKEEEEEEEAEMPVD